MYDHQILAKVVNKETHTLAELHWHRHSSLFLGFDCPHCLISNVISGEQMRKHACARRKLAGVAQGHLHTLHRSIAPLCHYRSPRRGQLPVRRKLIQMSGGTISRHRFTGVCLEVRK